jgi:hypothetical protein
MHRPVPRTIQLLAAKYLVDPVRITVAKVNARSGTLQACTRVKQIVEVLPPARKDARLLELLREYFDRKRRVLVFVLYVHACPALPISSMCGDLARSRQSPAPFGMGVHSCVLSTALPPLAPCRYKKEAARVEQILSRVYPGLATSIHG